MYTYVHMYCVRMYFHMYIQYVLCMYVCIHMYVRMYTCTEYVYIHAYVLCMHTFVHMYCVYTYVLCTEYSGPSLIRTPWDQGVVGYMKLD